MISEAFYDHFDMVLKILTGLIIPFLGFIIFKLFRRPRIEAFIELGDSNRKRGKVTNYPIDSSEVPYAHDLNYEYDFTQNFTLRIINNSEIDAYDISLKIHCLENGSFYPSSSQSISPFKSHDEKSFDYIFRRTIEAGYNPPELFLVKNEIRDKLEIIISAKNKYRFKKFYTHFHIQANKFRFWKPNTKGC